jgi:hypothetical protein
MGCSVFPGKEIIDRERDGQQSTGSSCSSSAMGGGRSSWSSARTAILVTNLKSKSMGRERSGWGCSSWLTLGKGGSEREIDEGAVVAE